MTKTDFVDSNAVLIAEMMSIGTLSFLDPKGPEFTGLAWVIDRNLSWDELSLIDEYDLVVGEVCIVEVGYWCGWPTWMTCGS